MDIGVGNYLKAETLPAAGIAPLSQLGRPLQAKRLDLHGALIRYPGGTLMRVPVAELG